MPVFVCKFTVDMGGGQGNTELFYRTGTAADALTAISEVAKARVDTLHPNYSVKDVNVSDVDILGDIIRNKTDFPQKGKAGALAPPGLNRRDQANAALLCTLLGFEGTARYKRQLHIRGIPDYWIAYDADGLWHANQPADMVGPVNSYITKIIAQQMAMRVFDQSALINRPQQILAVAREPSMVSTGTLLNVPAHGLAPVVAGKATKVKVRSPKFLYPVYDAGGKTMTATWSLAVISDATAVAFPRADWLLIPYYMAPGVTPVVKAPGTLTTRVVTYPVIRAGTVDRPSTRRTGRVPNVPVGRRSKRR